MRKLSKAYLHLIFFGPLLFILCKISRNLNLQSGNMPEIGIAAGIAISTIGCILGFIHCREEERGLPGDPPPPSLKYILGECQTRKLGLLYSGLGLLTFHLSQFMSPDFRSIFAPGGVLCGMFGISFLLTSMFYSHKAGSTKS